MAKPIPPGFIFQSPIYFIALGFGAGLSPHAPGTVGTLIGFPLFLLLSLFPLGIQVFVLIVLFLIGCYLCEVTGKALGVPDHGGIVWDEIVAFCAVLMTVPAHWAWWVAAFATFRLFDIVKPMPIGWLDKHYKNGFGVMIDDVMAAIYAMASLALLQVLL